MGIRLLQMASFQDRDLGSDPLGLTFLPTPRQFIYCQNWSHWSELKTHLKTDTDEDHAGPQLWLQLSGKVQ